MNMDGPHNLRLGTLGFVPSRKVPCRFFANGANGCRYGQRCRFSHELLSGRQHSEIADDAARSSRVFMEPSEAMFGGGELVETGEELSMSEQLDDEQADRSNFKDDGTLEDVVNGVVVVYGPGAEVRSIKLRQDMSNIKVIGLAEAANRYTVANYLKQLGFDVIVEMIEMQKTSNNKVFATVRLEDTPMAKNIVEKADAEMGLGTSGEISVKVVTNNSRFGNRVDFSTVSVSWFKRSKKAIIACSSPALLNCAKNILSQTTTPAGRTIRCKPLRAAKGNRTRMEYIMAIENLHWDVSEDWLKAFIEPALTTLDQQDTNGELPHSVPPIRYIRIMNPKYRLNEDESGELVQALLKSIGPLELFDVYDEGRSIKIKAEATFVNAQHASEAAKVLNAVTHPEFGELAVELLSSAKFNITNKIVRVLRHELDRFEHRVRSQGKLNIKNSTLAEKSYTVIQLWGVGSDAPKNVASSRLELEKLLEGTIMLVDGKAFWDQVFKKHDSLAMLNTISRLNGLYIHRDLSREHLVIYGGNPLTRRKAVQDLFHGIRTLKETLKTSISLAPSLPPVPQAEPQGCATCFTAPENPITTRCGHVYCTECFSSQISSADEQTLPLLCHGAEDTCKHAFGLKELKELIPLTYFQDLLVVALKTYIRTHPTEYAYCPTPDCTSVYRVHQLPEEGEKEGDNVFFCTECLSTSCMTCGTPTHKGTTCRENKAAIDGAAELAVYMAENGTKRCLQCQTLIEKVEGCNHLICPGCSTHICWVCEALFPNEDLCYQHLRREHGGYGLPFEGGPNHGGGHGGGGGGDDDDGGEPLIEGHPLAGIWADLQEAVAVNAQAGQAPAADQ